MGYCILWFFSLTAAVLTVALGAALSVRLQKRRQAIAAVVASALPGLLVGISGVVISGAVLARGVPHHWFGYSLSWLLVFVAGSVLLCLWALGSEGDVPAPRARSWPPSRIATGLGAAAAVFLAALWYMDIAARTELRQLHAEALARLLAVQAPRIPDHKNAAHLYTQAFDMMGDYISWRKMTWHRRIEDPVPEADTSEIREFLREQSGTLALLRRASAMPDFFSETNHARGLSMRVPRLMRWINASRILILSGRNRAARGDVGGALEDVAAARRMSGHLASGSAMMSVSTAILIGTSASNAYEQILSFGPVTGRALGGLPLKVSSNPLRAAHMRAWEAEAASFVLFLAGGDSPALLYPVARGETPPRRIETQLADHMTILWRVFFLRQEIEMYETWMNRTCALSGLPYAEMLKRAKKSYPDLTRPHDWGLLLPITCPSIDSFGMMLVDDRARQGLADLALAAEAYRGDKGRYPATLAELTPTYIDAIPVDPYVPNAERLKMIAVEDGAVLYSVGLNGKDDGGTMLLGASFAHTEGDLAFCLGAAYEERRLKPARAAAERRKARKTKQK